MGHATRMLASAETIHPEDAQDWAVALARIARCRSTLWNASAGFDFTLFVLAHREPAFRRLADRLEQPC
jgi:hypothetical protein